MIEVSIIIPTFNRAGVVGRAIQSGLAQSSVVEVIVVDDGSTDGTKEMIEESYGTRMPKSPVEPSGTSVRSSMVRYLAQPNQGVCAARNRGLLEATGEFVKFLDSDDELVMGALAEELRVARETRADVVVSAWEERTPGNGRDIAEQRCLQPCPVLNQPIDDMLKGQSPWTAAALYRRAFVADLRWNAEFGKADDWAWAWTVCLAGARYAMTDCVSAIYWHHAGDRITSEKTAFADSTHMRQRILNMVESSLDRMNALTDARRQALSQYYYKDRLVVCEDSVDAWRRLWAHCRDLAPGFRPEEWHRMVRLFVRVFGVFWGVRLYVALRRGFRLARSA
jgi:glycosyltransferase involved in cell wall biosynthesis